MKIIIKKEYKIRSNKIIKNYHVTNIQLKQKMKNSRLKINKNNRLERRSQP